MTRRADHAHYGWRHGRVVGAVRLAVMEMNAGKVTSCRLLPGMAMLKATADLAFCGD